MKTEKEIAEQAEVDQAVYRAKCTHSRVGGLVRENNDSGTVVFDGTKDCKGKDCLGINSAKRYVRKNNLVVFKETA